MLRGLHVCPTAAGVAKPAPPVCTLTAASRHRTPALASCSRLGTYVSNTTRRRGSTRVSAAATESAPLTPNLWWTKNPPPNMRDVSNVQELVDELAAAGDKLVIIDFYAGWCNACKAVYPKLRKICLANEDIVMLKVNWDDARLVCKTLGIKVLPYFNFYRGVDGKVAAFSASVAKVQRLRDAIEEHSSPRCQLGPHEGPWLDEFPEVMPSFDRDYMPVIHPLLPGEPLHKTLRDATTRSGGSGLQLGGFSSGDEVDIRLAGAR